MRLRSKVWGTPIRTLVERYGRLVGSCLLFAWLAFLLTKGQPNFDLSVFPATLRLHLLFAALALAYLANLLILRRLPGPTRLDWPIAALAVVYIGATLDSVYPRVSLEASLLIGAVVLTFYAFHDFTFLSTEATMRVLAAAGTFAGAVVLYHLSEDYVDWLRLANAVGLNDVLPPAIPRVRGVGDNANAIAMALNLTWPFALAAGLRQTRRLETALALAASVVILAAIVLTLSRGAWLGMIASVCAFAVLYALRDRDPVASLAPLARWTKLAGALAGIALLLVLAGGLVLATRWDSRPTWLFRSSLSPRYDAMQVGVDIFRDRPLLGAGPYTYPLLYNTYSGEYPVENIHPHNGYLGVLDATGIAGGAVLLAGAVVLFLGLARAYRLGEAPQRLRIAACVAALASLAVHALVDTPNVWLTALLPFAAVLALTCRLTTVSGGTSRSPRLAPRLTPLALVPCLLGAWLLLDLRHASYDDSLHGLAAGRFADAATQATKAADEDPAHAASQINAGVARTILFLVDRDRVRLAPGAEPLADALPYFRRAIEHEPRSAVAYANLGLALRIQAGYSHSSSLKDEAVRAAQAAIQRAPTDGTIAAAAGTVLEWADHQDEALFAYGRAVKADPSLAQSPFWATTAVRTDLRPGALESSGVSRCQWGRASAIYGGFPDDLDYLALGCRGEVEKSPGDARARGDLAIMLYVLGRRDEARREAEEAVRRVPDNPFARTALGIVNGGDGDLQGARQELARAAYIRGPGDPDAALLLAYTYQPPAGNNPVIGNLHLPTQRGEIPRAVRDRLEDAYNAAAPMVFDHGRQRYLLGILYYRARLLRESPTSILIPDEWLEFASPRALLIEEALERSK